MINETKIETVTKIAENLKKEDLQYILETITYLKLWLILFMLVVVKVILIKTIKTCKKIYIVHNERIIRQNGATTQA